MATTTHQSSLTIGVVGLGPVGCILAVHLKDAGATVVACDIDQLKIAAMQKNGIQLVHTIQKQVYLQETCTSIAEMMTRQLDLVVIAVKAPYLKRVIKELAEYREQDFFLLSAQNGIDNELELAEVFGAYRTLRMVINYAGNMLDRSTVNVGFFNPPNYLAPLDSQGKSLAEQLVAMLNQTGLTTVIPNRLDEHIWGKAILNASLAPVCAIAGKTMQEIMEHPQGRQLVISLLDEALQVAAAEGIHYPADYMEQCLKYLDLGGGHRPSMLVDLDNERPTEINYLNGRIVEYGKKHGVDTPMNQTITTLIQLLDQSFRRGGD
ncbi:MAG: ketopantoate reductase family protein [Fidelibacterota bacterium]